MTPWPAPHSSAQMTWNVPTLFGLTITVVVMPGTTSSFTRNCVT